jgi:hypothetical protein
MISEGYGGSRGRRDCNHQAAKSIPAWIEAKAA